MASLTPLELIKPDSYDDKRTNFSACSTQISLAELASPQKANHDGKPLRRSNINKK